MSLPCHSQLPVPVRRRQLGWIHLLVGLIVVMTGFAILAGRNWGRVVGITLAMVSALANFLFIPCYPFWGADCHRPGHS